MRFRLLGAATFLGVMGVMLSGVPAYAQPQPRGLAVVPDEERRSQIVEVLGLAQIPPALRSQRGSADTERLRNEALRAARIAAHERVSREISNSPNLELRNGPDSQDVVVIETRDVSAPQDQFQIWARVEVRLYPTVLLAGPPPSSPGQPQPAAPQVPSATTGGANQQEPLTVTIRTDRREYVEGEEIIVTVRGNRDFYGRITYEDASGRIIQVLPNAFRSEARFEGNRDYRIPGDGDRFRLRVTAPFGQERFTVYASTAPIAQIAAPPQQRGAGVTVAEQPRPDVGLRARGLEVVEAAPMPAAPTRSVAAPPVNAASVDFYEAVWLVTTLPIGGQAPAAPAPSSAPGGPPPAQAAPPAIPPPPVAAPAPAAPTATPPTAAARPETRRPAARPQQQSTTADARLPRQCSAALGRQLLRDINRMKPIRNSDVDIVDLINLRTTTIDASGLNCAATLLASNGERVDATIRIFISSLGEVLFELKLV